MDILKTFHTLCKHGKCFVACFVALSSLPLPAHAESEYYVAGTVSEKALSNEDVVNRIRMIALSSGQPASQEVINMLYPRVIRMLLDENLQKNWALRHKIMVTKKEIEQRIKDIEQRNKMPEGALIKTLKDQNIPLQTFTDQIEASLIWSKYLEQKYFSQLAVSSEEIERVRTRLKQEANEDHFQWAEIVIYVSSPQSLPEIYAHAEKLKDMFYQGTPFDRLVQQFSQSISKEQGGLSGWRSIKRLDPPFAKILQNAEIGQLIGPVVFPSKESPSQVMLLVLLDSRKAGTQKMPELTDTMIGNILKNERLELFARREMESLRKKIHHEARLKRLMKKKDEAPR
jgi:parvulin-like peptidyl-prolyl isomerase